MRTLEAQGIAEAGGDAFTLMARAGQAGWRCLLKHWPHAMRILVVCGAGNNGGDGYVLAKHARLAGRAVHVVALKSPESALAQRAAAEFLAVGGGIQAFTSELPEADVIVDALFGIGLSRAPDSVSAALIDAMNQHPAAVLALDVPSGIDAARGHRHAVAINADCTLQFLGRHQGLRTGAALDACGHLELASLDLPQHLPAFAHPTALAYRADALRDFFPLRDRDSHKGRNGHVLCVGGNHGSGGAILLAAQAALRSGAGLVSVATRSEHVTAILTRTPEAMVHAVDDTTYLEMLIARADVIAIGPGLGQEAWSVAMLEAVLQAKQPRVWDADALNILSRREVRCQSDDIVTPHPGEAARLLGGTTEMVQSDRFSAAHALQEKLDCTVVLKGAGTVVKAASAPAAIISAGNPGMSVGGMGDVLTGCVAALLAQRMPAHSAAIAGALLHAAAGDAAVMDDGERGLLPSDLLPWLRKLANPYRR